MSLVRGRKTQFSMSDQETANTAGVYASSIAIPHTNIDVNSSNEVAVKEVATGNIYGVSDTDTGIRRSSFTLDGVIDLTTIGHIMRWAFGQVSETQSGSNYTHTFTASSSNLHKTLFKVYQAVDGTFRGQRYKNSVIDTLTITISDSGYIAFSATGVGAGEEEQSVSEARTYETGASYLIKDMKAFLKSGTSAISPTDEVNVSSVTITITRTNVENTPSGDDTPSEFILGNFDVQVAATLKYDIAKDTEIKAMYDDQEEARFRVEMNTDDIVLDMFGRVVSKGDSQELDGIVSTEIEFRAVVDGTNEPATVTITNEVSTYN